MKMASIVTAAAEWLMNVTHRTWAVNCVWTASLQECCHQNESPRGLGVIQSYWSTSGANVVSVETLSDLSQKRPVALAVPDVNI